MPSAESVRAFLAGITLERIALRLPEIFYALTGLALLLALLGAPGIALLLLIAAGLVHVARVGVEAAPATRRHPLRR